MFTVTLQKQSQTFKDILELLFPKSQHVGKGAKGIELTHGGYHLRD